MVLELSLEQEAFRQSVVRFADEAVRPVARAIDESDTFPRELVRQAGALGLMGVTIPKAWSGVGRDYVSYALAIEEIAHGQRHAGCDPRREQLARGGGHCAV